MIGVAFRQVELTGATFLTLGPVWTGLVVRAVHLVVHGGVGATLVCGIVVAEGRVVTLSDFNSALSLIVSGDLLLSGFEHPLFQMAVTSGAAHALVLPVYVPVHSGPAYVAIGGRSITAVCRILAGLEVEPERLIRPALEPPVAAAGRVRGDGVLRSLREAAVAARAS